MAAENFRHARIASRKGRPTPGWSRLGYMLAYLSHVWLGPRVALTIRADRELTPYVLKIALM